MKNELITQNSFLKSEAVNHVFFVFLAKHHATAIRILFPESDKFDFFMKCFSKTLKVPID